MSFIIVILIVIALLFVLAFVTKRRFGVLGLALAAETLLSTMWVGNLTPIVAQTGIVIVRPPLESVVAAALVLLPAVLLLMSGPTYKTRVQRTIGAVAFAVLATAFLLPALGSALVIDTMSAPIYAFFVQYHNILVTAGLVLAIGDLLMVKTPKQHKEHDKH